MKKSLLVLVSFGFLMSCNSGGDKPGGETKKDDAVAAADLSSNPDYQKGLDLIAKSDCLTCHAPVDKINGPAYKEVANKYAGMPDTIIAHLAKKIISGGTGVWGEVPMTPHPGVSQADAEAMVKYVMLLK